MTDWGAALDEIRRTRARSACRTETTAKTAESPPETGAATIFGSFGSQSRVTSSPSDLLARDTVPELAETLPADLARAGWPWPDDGGGACGPESSEDAVRAAWEAWVLSPERTEDELDGAWQQVDRIWRATTTVTP